MKGSLLGIFQINFPKIEKRINDLQRLGSLTDRNPNKGTLPCHQKSNHE